MAKPRKTTKEVRFTLRMRREQRRQLEEAAAIESHRRPSAIEAGPLLLELAMPGIEQILAGVPAKRVA